MKYKKKEQYFDIHQNIVPFYLNIICKNVHFFADKETNQRNHRR